MVRDKLLYFKQIVLINSSDWLSLGNFPKKLLLFWIYKTSKLEIMKFIQILKFLKFLAFFSLFQVKYNIFFQSWRLKTSKLSSENVFLLNKKKLMLIFFEVFRRTGLMIKSNLEIMVFIEIYFAINIILFSLIQKIWIFAFTDLLDR